MTLNAELREQFIAYLQSLPLEAAESVNNEVESVDDTPPEEDAATEAPEQPAETQAVSEPMNNPSVSSGANTNNSVTGSPDITLTTSEDMLSQSIDQRLADFYTKQVELENTVKIVLDEIKAIKGNIATVEGAIDVAAATSPTVAGINELLQQI